MMTMKIDRIKLLQRQGELMRQLAIVCQAIDCKKIKGLSYFYNNDRPPEFIIDEYGNIIFDNIKFTLNGIRARGVSPNVESVVHGCLTLEWHDESVVMVGKNCQTFDKKLNKNLRESIAWIDEERAEQTDD